MNSISNQKEDRFRLAEEDKFFDKMTMLDQVVEVILAQNERSGTSLPSLKSGLQLEPSKFVSDEQGEKIRVEDATAMNLFALV